MHTLMDVTAPTGGLLPLEVTLDHAQALELRADPAPYLTPFLRSFLLGVSFGAMFELVHVFSQVSLPLLLVATTLTRTQPSPPVPATEPV